MNLSNIEFLTWIKERMIHVHKENENFDYIHRFNSVIDDVRRLEAENAELKIENEELREL